ncbi:hypothetical protein JZ751_016227, partial [Albula glossodonta]
MEIDQLKEKVAKLEEDQAVHSEASMDSTDGAEGDLSSAQKESPVSKKRSSSSSDPPTGNLIEFGGEPSTSKASTWDSKSDARPKGKDPEEPVGGGDKSEFRCCLLEELKRVPGCAMHLGPLSFSGQHTVLVDVDALNNEGRLKAQGGQSMWDGRSVKMPYAVESTVTKTGFFQTEKQQRWETINKHLRSLAKSKSVTPLEVEKAIKKYNPKYEDLWTFDGLHYFFKVLPVSENPTYSRILSR